MWGTQVSIATCQRIHALSSCALLRREPPPHPPLGRTLVLS